MQYVSIDLIVRMAFIVLASLSISGILVPLPYSTRKMYHVYIHAESMYAYLHAKPSSAVP